MSDEDHPREPPVTRAVRLELQRLVREDPRSQEDIATAAGVSTDTLMRRVTGKSRLLFKDAEVLLAALGWPEGELVKVVRAAGVRLSIWPASFGGALTLPADPASPEWAGPAHAAGPSRWCPRRQADNQPTPDGAEGDDDATDSD
ncbi:MAG: hypothetical protein GY719_26100 [bacterium]|nr:hypothetical protein [bacterium]